MKEPRKLSMEIGYPYVVRCEYLANERFVTNGKIKKLIKTPQVPAQGLAIFHTLEDAEGYYTKTCKKIWDAPVGVWLEKMQFRKENGLTIADNDILKHKKVSPPKRKIKKDKKDEKAIQS